MICIVRGEKADAPVCSPHCDLSAAIRLAAAMEARGSTVRIFAVAEDGTETMLPTYEEALRESESSRRLGEIQVLAYQLDAVLRGTMGGDALDLVSRISALTLPAGAKAKGSAT